MTGHWRSKAIASGTQKPASDVDSFPLIVVLDSATQPQRRGPPHVPDVIPVIGVSFNQSMTNCLAIHTSLDADCLKHNTSHHCGREE